MNESVNSDAQRIRGFLLFIILCTIFIIGITITLLQSTLKEFQTLFLCGIMVLGGLCGLCAYLVLCKVGKKKASASPVNDEQISHASEAPPITTVVPPPQQQPATAPQQQINTDAGAILLLSMLQEKGRFVDFLMENILHYSDEQVGAAARVVHQGCRELIIDSFNPQPLSAVKEDEAINLEQDYPKTDYKLNGTIPQTAQLRGTVVHKGWRAQQLKLPRLIQPEQLVERRVIAPAEVQF
ncbi:MAG: DUF2760 domain-containing protein [Chitinivibrionales bacterium]|nr:DUF2760 domain-containing protein [Chitinivibrionales bacterium]